MSLGNLLTEAGFEVIESRPYYHRWLPKRGSMLMARIGGRTLFELTARAWGRVPWKLSQVRAVAVRPE